MSYIIFPKLRTRLSIFALPALALMLWLEGASAFIILLASAILHEIGHILAIGFCGYRVRRIDVLPMGAIIVVPEGIPDFYEFVIAVSGPAVSVACGFLGLAIFLITNSVWALFFAFVNLILGFFNLMPITKLDGGKALLSLLRHKNIKNADRISACVSKIGFSLIVFLLTLCFVLSNCNLGVLILCLALALQLA